MNGHWLLWIEHFNRMREMLFHKDGDIQQEAKDKLKAYIDMAMNSSYGDDLRVIHNSNEMYDAAAG